MFNQIKYVLLKFCTYCNMDCSYCIVTDKKSKDKQFIFNQAKELRKLLETIDVGPVLDIELTGGECSLVTEQIRDFYKEIKKIERSKDTRVTMSTVTNGTGLDKLFPLMDNKILDPWSMKLSWDGIYSSSQCRKPKDINSKYTDTYFNKQIYKLGNSKYNKDVLVRIALTNETIDDLYDSFVFAVNAGCNKIEYYPLYLRGSNIHYYYDKEFLKKFEAQIRKIAKFYIDHPFDYENWNYLYYTSTYKDKPFNLGCHILGRMLYVNTDGSIYPCALFSENFQQDFYLGSVKSGLSYPFVKYFIDSYSDFAKVNYRYCGNCDKYHCDKCPAMLYYMSSYKSDMCYLNAIKEIEYKVFSELAPKIDKETKIKIIKRLDFVNDKPLTFDIPEWLVV